jgi:hypothetical protein
VKERGNALKAKCKTGGIPEIKRCKERENDDTGNKGGQEPMRRWWRCENEESSAAMGVPRDGEQEAIEARGVSKSGNWGAPKDRESKRKAVGMHARLGNDRMCQRANAQASEITGIEKGKDIRVSKCEDRRAQEFGGARKTGWNEEMQTRRDGDARIWEQYWGNQGLEHSKKLAE